MVVSDGLHQNAGRAEQPLVLGLETDRKAGKLPGVEETTHAGNTLSPHEVRPFKDTCRRRVGRARPVRRHLAAPGRAEVEARVHRALVEWRSAPMPLQSRRTYRCRSAT